MSARFAATIEDTDVGASGVGQYAMAVFNPSTSGKRLTVRSIRTMVNYGNTTTWLYRLSVDPNYASDITPTPLDIGSSAASSANVSANTATISFPDASDRLVQAIASPEMITNGVDLSIRPGYGLLILVFANNNQQYAITAEWDEE